MTETLLLDRYRKADELAPRFGGAALLAEDLERQGQLVEVHQLPATAALEAAYAPVRQAIDALQAIPAGPLARPLDVSWGPDGELVLVIEYQEGRRLSDVLAAERLTPRRAREVLRGALHALVLARRAGLFHGALTPARILLGQDDRVALLDLGLSALPRPTPDAGADPAVESYEAAYRVPGDGRGARSDAYAIAVLALELATGQRPAAGSKAAPEVAPEVAQVFGPEFVKAAGALVRLDGSARAFDAGALLGLLAASQKKTRRGRFTLRESWDGDIGGGTARLLKLALRPEFRDRMPEEIRGQRAAVEDEPGAEVKFVETIAPRPSERVAAAAPKAPPPPPPATPAPVGLTPPAPAADIKTVPMGRLSPTAAVATSTAESDPFDFDQPGLVPPLAAPPAGAPPPIPWGNRPEGSPASVLPKTEPPPAKTFVQQQQPATLGPQITITPRAAASHDSGALVTMPISTPPPPPAEPVIPGSHLLYTPGGTRAWFLIAPKDLSLDLGRERGNEVILRAFKNNAVESVDSNRISRKHLGIARRGGQVFIGDKKSTYGTALGPTRLPPEGETALPPVFQLTLAQTSVRLDGRVLAGGCALRLNRLDSAGHQYLVAWAGPELTVGSSEATDAVHLTEAGVLPGHARLVIDLARGAWLIGPKAGKVGVGGREVPPGQLAPLGAEPVQLGALALRARPARDDDFLSVASLLPA